MCGATRDVRFTPNSDRESEIPQKAMSALPPKADMCGATRDVRFGPIADSCGAARGSLFDQLIGAGEHGGWHCKAKRFGRLKIDHQLVLGRRLSAKGQKRAHAVQQAASLFDQLVGAQPEG